MGNLPRRFDFCPFRRELATFCRRLCERRRNRNDALTPNGLVFRRLQARQSDRSTVASDFADGLGAIYRAAVWDRRRSGDRRRVYRGVFSDVPFDRRGGRRIEPIYLKAAQNFGIREPQILWKIAFPAALPRIATGARLALGSAWIFLVAGETMGAQSGLGFLVIDARNNLRLDILLAAIATIGLTGLALDSAIKVVEKRLLKALGTKRRILKFETRARRFNETG